MRTPKTALAAAIVVATLAGATPADAGPDVEYVELTDRPNASIRQTDLAQDTEQGRTVVAWGDPDIGGVRVAMVDAAGEVIVGPVDIPDVGSGVRPVSIDRNPAGWLLAYTTSVDDEQRLVTRFLTDRTLRVGPPVEVVTLDRDRRIADPELVYLPGAGHHLLVFESNTPWTGGDLETISAVPLTIFGAAMGAASPVITEVIGTPGPRRLGAPSVAVGADGHHALITASGDLESLGLPVGEFEVVARAVTARGVASGAPVRLSLDARDAGFEPDDTAVSGLGDGYVVAYRNEDLTVAARAVDLSGNPIDLGEQPLVPEAGPADRLALAADGAGGAIVALTPRDLSAGRLERIRLDGATIVLDGDGTAIEGRVDDVGGDTSGAVWSFVDGGTPTLGLWTPGQAG